MDGFVHLPCDVGASDLTYSQPQAQTDHRLRRDNLHITARNTPDC